MSSSISISLLCPTFNEVNYIKNILNFFVSNSTPNKELFIIDGGSTDGTIAIIEEWLLKYNNIYLLRNPNKTVPYALNIGLKQAKGNIIIRLDAHTIYSPDYIQKIIETFEKTDVDIVGGPMNPMGETNFQKAVAAATTSSFGVGNSKFHDIHYEGYVDSVYLGAWRKSIFKDVGNFDVQMKRNQDDEFHYRAKSFGKKIYLNPQIKSSYFPRATFLGLFKQYFQYGLYKPLVIKKNKSEVKLRHLVPLLFVIYLVALLFFAKYFIFLIPLFIYLFLDFFISIRARENLIVRIILLLIFPTLHISYGLGFILGISKTFDSNSIEQ
jgi:succinoglycan biosynthesis protein ExoA